MRAGRGAMQQGKGKRFSTDKLEKIKVLLKNTDMTISEIAERMGCSAGAVVSTNRKFKIRSYNHRRNRWCVSADL